MPTMPAWRERWVVSYIFDYVIIIVLILGFSALDLVEPYKQRFSLTNESLQYPYANPERIPAAWAGVIACLFPLLCLIAWTMIIDGFFSHRTPPSNRRRIMGGPWSTGDRLWEMNCAILGLGLSVAGAICITGALKNVTGKPRPDVIARCIPPANAANDKVFGLFDPARCTQTDHSILKDGFKSWPSGHSSTSFAGLGYLSLFLAGKLHIMDNRGEVWKTFIVLVPLLAAALVAVSRIMDARHHPFDVITGSMLGQATAWVAYRQYFPPITEPSLKGRAYPRRTWGTDPHERPFGYGLHSLEEGDAGGYGSSASVDSEGHPTGTRRRDVMPRSTADPPSQVFELLPQQPQPQQKLQQYPPPPPPQQQQQHQHQQRSGTFPLDHQSRAPGAGGSTEYRASVDMGERGRQGPGLESPESIGRPLRLGRLSPPPEQAEESKESKAS